MDEAVQQKKVQKYEWPPLKIQFEAGRRAFINKDPKTKTSKTGHTIILTHNPYKEGTMQWKEWQRGFDTTFTDRQKWMKENGY